ncbi:MAG: ABC transporter permease [Acidimicrobiia bacterium]
MDTEDTGATSRLTSINAPLSTTKYLAAMWDRREFAIEVPLEQLRSAHKLTLLGNMWHLGNPLLSVAVYYLIFGVIFEVNRGVDHFLLWLMIGVFAFRLTSSTVLGGANAITSNVGLIKAMKFPRALLPVSVVTSQLLTFFIELGVIGALVLLSGLGLSQRWLMLPLVVAVHTALNLGGALISARLNDAFKDVQQIIPFLFRLLQYLSGVMFPIERLLSGLGDNGWATTLVKLNPITRIIEMYRWVFLGTTLDWGSMAWTAVIAGLVFWFGFRFFRAAEWRYGRA